MIVTIVVYLLCVPYSGVFSDCYYCSIVYCVCPIVECLVIVTIVVYLLCVPYSGVFSDCYYCSISTVCTA